MAQTITPTNSLTAPARQGLNILPVIYALACWPVWLWMLERMRDRSDDPLGLLALVAALGLCCVGGPTKQPGLTTKQVGILVACLLISTCGSLVLPMLIRAAAAMTGLAVLLSQTYKGRTLHIPTWGLLLLSLPVVATMQFYLGFPLRLLVVHAVFWLTSTAGYAMAINGTDLIWQGHIIGIDPACSGVRMLWTAFFVGFACAAINQLNNRKALFLTLLTLLIALFGNIFRATTLVMIDLWKDRTGGTLPEFIHPLVGIVLFAFIVCALALLAKFLSTPSNGTYSHKRHEITGPASKAQKTLLILVSCLCAVTPLVIPTAIAQKLAASPVIALKQLDGKPLIQLPLTRQEELFADGFPGAIHKYTDGRREIVVRTVFQPTRQLHPSEDCFRGMGYKVTSRPSEHTAKASAWGTFEASNEQMQLKVREQISDQAGNSWTDVSSWYWSAIFGKSHGPWTAVTIAEPMQRSASAR